MRVTVTVDVDGRAASVTVNTHPADVGLEAEPEVVLERLLADAQQRASAEARKRKSGPHAWAGFLRVLLQRLGTMGPGDCRTRPARPTPAMRPSRPVEVELGEFAADVLLVLTTVGVEWVPSGHGGALVPRGRFGEKVFIAAAYRALRASDSRYASLPLDVFKGVLLVANRDGLLALSRADLVGAMDPGEVADSAIEDGGASFHFVQAPRRR